MIKNDRQREIAKKKLYELEESLKNINKKYSSNKMQLKLLSRGYKEHIAQIKKEIEEYKKMKEAPLPRILKAHSPADISHQLIRLRVSKGITQEKLAKSIGCKQADISRLEQEGYGGYTITQLKKVADSLDANIEISFIPGKKKALQ